MQQTQQTHFSSPKQWKSLFTDLYIIHIVFIKKFLFLKRNLFHFLSKKLCKYIIA